MECFIAEEAGFVQDVWSVSDPSQHCSKHEAYNLIAPTSTLFRQAAVYALVGSHDTEKVLGQESRLGELWPRTCATES